MSDIQAITSHAPFESDRRAPLVLRFGFWFSVGIGVAVVIRRVVALANPVGGSSGPTAGLDFTFSQHAILTLAHILPALFFVLLAPLIIFWRRGRAAWADLLFYPIGAVVGLTAYAMSSYAVGGWTERSAVLLFDSIFLVALWKAWRFRQLHDAVGERRWLLRAVVVLLGIATTRPVMGVFFATSRLTHLQPEQFFGIAFWIGFGINTIMVEWWLRRKHSPST